MESRARQSMRIKSVQASACPGRPAQAILALLVFTAVPARVALAQPAPSASPIALPEATPQDAVPLPGPAPPNVDVPAALKGRLVVVTTAARPTEGRLQSIDDGERAFRSSSRGPAPGSSTLYCSRSPSARAMKAGRSRAHPSLVK